MLEIWNVVNALDDFNVCKYSTYPKKGKVVFNESSMKQKFYCIPYYLGMRKILPEQMNEQVEYEQRWHKRLERNGIYWFRRRGDGSFKEVLAKLSLCQDALRTRYILMK